MKAARAPRGVLVLVCAGHGEDGVDLVTLPDLVARAAKAAHGGEVACVAVDNLCTRPRALARALKRTPSAVVVVAPCPSHRTRRMPVRDVRDVVEHRLPGAATLVVEPGDVLATDPEFRTRTVAALLAAYCVAGFPPDSEPPHLGRGESDISRRTLLTAGLASHRPRPALADGACGSSPWCRVCVTACPAAALSVSGGIPSVDIRACDACGACVTACPADALTIDSLPRTAWERHLTALLSAAGTLGLPIGVRWACADASEEPAPPDGAAWLRLRLPCVRALTPGWLLQPLAAGAAGVAVEPCARCRDQWVPTAPRSRLLTLVTSQVSNPLSPCWPRPRGAEPASAHVVLREPAATADAVLRLAGRNPFTVVSAAASLGTVACDDDRCTACELCARACPTGALGAVEGTDTWQLRLDPSACAACGACAAVCPEAALRVHPRIDVGDLRRGARTIARVALCRCVRCGRPLPSPALRTRLVAAGVRVADDELCADCRLGSPTAAKGR